MPDQNLQLQLNKGHGTIWGRGFELALTPVFFGLIGWVVDMIAGTDWVFTIAFAAFGTVGVFVKMWIGYDREMRAEEHKLFDRPSKAAAE